MNYSTHSGRLLSKHMNRNLPHHSLSFHWRRDLSECGTNHAWEHINGIAIAIILSCDVNTHANNQDWCPLLKGSWRIVWNASCRQHFDDSNPLINMLCPIHFIPELVAILKWFVHPAIPRISFSKPHPHGLSFMPRVSPNAFLLHAIFWIKWLEERRRKALMEQMGVKGTIILCAQKHENFLIIMEQHKSYKNMSGMKRTVLNP